MAELADGIGDAVTGAAIARSIDSHADAAGRQHGHACLNCGTGLIGDFCYRCGQAGHVHRSLAAIWHDIAHGVLHFEGKIWRTLPLLVFKPGELTRRYIAGERARFVSPMALFLFSVFTIFALLQIFGAHFEAPKMTEKEQAQAIRELDEELAASTRRLEDLQRKRREAIAARKQTGEIDQQLAWVRRDIAANRTAAEIASVGRSNSRFMDFDTGWERLDKGIKKANANPDLALYKIQNSAYKFSWALIPISIPFLWLMFAWRRQYKVYDHAIFVIYSLSFVTLLIMALMIAYQVGATEDTVWSIFLFGVPIHMLVQLRGAYRLGWLNATIRAFFLATFASIATAVFVMLLLALGVLG